jgi:hypothetical protein
VGVFEEFSVMQCGPCAGSGVVCNGLLGDFLLCDRCQGSGVFRVFYKENVVGKKILCCLPGRDTVVGPEWYPL